MADEAEVVSTVPAQAAPETVETASTVEAPVSGETKPEVKDEQKAEKTFSQAELDALIGKRLARERRSWEREHQSRQAPEPKPEAQPTAKPTPDKFDSTEAYIEAVSDWKAKQVVEQTLSDREKQQREEHQRRAQATAQAQYGRKEEIARAQYDDFDDVVYNPHTPITEAMAHAIQFSDRGPDIAYHLGKNPQEAARIAQLSPFLQAKEIGRIEAKLPDAAPKTTTSAPAPIKPLGGSKGSQVTFTSTDDPRAAEKLTPTEWIHLREKEKREKWKAQGYR